MIVNYFALVTVLDRRKHHDPQQSGGGGIELGRGGGTSPDTNYCSMC